MSDYAFDGVLEDWLQEQLADSPVMASALGADGAHGEIDDLSEESFAKRRRANNEWIERLGSTGDDGLSPAQRVDRDGIVSTLRGRVVLESWQAWRRDPMAYLDPCFEGVLTLVVHRIFPEQELAGYVASRLRAIAGALESGRANLSAELASPLIVGRAQQQCEAAVSYFEDALPLEFSVAELRESVAQAGRVAAEACAAFGSFLAELGEAAQGSYALGENRYTALLHERELFDFDVRELRERGRRVFAELEEEANEIASRIDPGASSWAEVFNAARDHHAEDFEGLRVAYANESEKARAYLVEHGLVSFPDDEECVVEPTPEVLRPVLAVASYFSPPAFRPGRRGHFNVPWPPQGSTAEEDERRLAANSFQSIPTVTVHEAYPGHHWHLTWMKANPRRVRQFIHSSYFSEGWALYAEKMMREQGYFADDTSLLGHLNARIWRAGRIVVDTGLHIGDMNFEDAVMFMRDGVGLTEPVARAEVGRYCQWPTQAPSYLTGCLEIERMRERFVSEEGRDLRQFHDLIAGSGCLPVPLAERALIEGG
ncbi:MAG: DUF885 domain-containing protein [Acidimicrobiales bacterium]